VNKEKNNINKFSVAIAGTCLNDIRHYIKLWAGYNTTLVLGGCFQLSIGKHCLLLRPSPHNVPARCISFPLDGWLRSFFLLGDCGCFSSILCCLVSGSQWRIHVSSYSAVYSGSQWRIHVSSYSAVYSLARSDGFMSLHTLLFTLWLVVTDSCLIILCCLLSGSWWRIHVSSYSAVYSGSQWRIHVSSYSAVYSLACSDGFMSLHTLLFTLWLAVTDSCLIILCCLLWLVVTDSCLIILCCLLSGSRWRIHVSSYSAVYSLARGDGFMSHHRWR
jgi:hypothetical protein